MSNYRLIVDGKPVSGSGEFLNNEIRFRDLSIVLPAGDSAGILLKADINANASAETRHGLSINGYRLSMGSITIEKEVSPIFEIGETAKATVRFPNIFAKQIIGNSKMGDRFLIPFTVLNPPRGAKIALFLEFLQRRETLLVKNVPVEHQRVEIVIPTEDCGGAGTNCFPLTPGSYNLKIVMYTGDDFCQTQCPANTPKPKVLGLDRTDNYVQITEAEAGNGDLIVESITVTPNPMLTDEHVKISYVIKNIGTEKIASPDARFRARNNTTGSDLGGFSGINLAAGESYPFSQTDSRPFSASCAHFPVENEIQAIIDYDNDVNEKNETNNSLTIIVECVSEN